MSLSSSQPCLPWPRSSSQTSYWKVGKGRKPPPRMGMTTVVWKFFPCQGWVLGLAAMTQLGSQMSAPL